MSQEYDVICISSGVDGFDKLVKDQGVRGYKIPFTRSITPLKDLVALIKLIWIFLKERPHIVHSHTTKDGFLCMIAAWITRVPHRLYTIAGLAEFTRKNQRFVDLIEKITFDCATLLLPNSKNMMEIYIKKGLLKRSKAKVIANGSSNGIDTSYFSRKAIDSNQRSLIRERYAISKTDFVYIFVGRIVGDKGVNELVRAFINLHNKNSMADIKLLLVGAFEKTLDALNPEIEKAIEEHPGIIHAGYQKDVRPFFVASDCLVFPSYREGMPNVVMQAGAMELPAIVSDINGCNEIIINEQNGFIVPRKDCDHLEKKMHYLYSNVEKGNEFGRKSRYLIKERFEQSMFWEALLTEYRSLSIKNK